MLTSLTPSSEAQPNEVLSRSLLTPRQWRTVTEALQLSPREEQIVRCIFDGRKEQAIALDLGISPHTVHTHLERLYHKINVTSRTEVVLRVFETYLQHIAAHTTQ